MLAVARGRTPAAEEIAERVAGTIGRETREWPASAIAAIQPPTSQPVGRARRYLLTFLTLAPVRDFSTHHRPGRPDDLIGEWDRCDVGKPRLL
jgi:hypothetical protein